jgi:hypothetical protein
VALAFEWVVPLMLANLAWAIALFSYVVLLVGIPILIVVAPLVALPTSALMRLAVTAVRAGVPTLGMARSEMGRLPLRKVGLAFVQLLLGGIAITNLDLAARMGGALGLVTGGVALYAVVAGALLSLAIWPIVCDPLREAGVREQLRLALTVTIRRPVQLAVLAFLAALAGYVALQLLLPIAFLPIIVLLAVAGYVVPAADEVLPPPEPA